MKTSHQVHKYLLSCLLFMFLGSGITYTYVTLRGPERCALCGGGVSYHAPVLLNLATGEMGALQVYETLPTRPGELIKEQKTGYFTFIRPAGAGGYCDGGVSCHVTLPEKTTRMKASLYCRNCRKRLSDMGGRGYVVLDLYDPNNIHIYPAEAGAAYSIRTYGVAIFRQDAGLELAVNGNE